MDRADEQSLSAEPAAHITHKIHHLVHGVDAAHGAGAHRNQSERTAHIFSPEIVEGIFHAPRHAAIVLRTDQDDRIGFQQAAAERMEPFIELFAPVCSVDVVGEIELLHIQKMNAVHIFPFPQLHFDIPRHTHRVPALSAGA